MEMNALPPMLRELAHEYLLKDHTNQMGTAPDDRIHRVKDSVLHVIGTHFARQDSGLNALVRPEYTIKNNINGK